jgi:methylglyoxal synthase
MKIAFIADAAKKKLMQNFCLAYRSTLMKHELYATGTTGQLIEDSTGLTLHKLLPGYVGGEEQLGIMIEQDQLDLLFFFRDPQENRKNVWDINKAIRLCDMHSIPLATNIATAEILLKSLEKGDLEWREMYR